MNALDKLLEEAEKHWETMTNENWHTEANCLRRLVAVVKRQREWIPDAVEVINQGVQLMPLHHMRHWEGVRAVIENEPTDDVNNLSEGKEG